MNTSLARLGSTAQDYERIGIRPDQVLPWEDGARTDGSDERTRGGTSTRTLDDGAKLVVVFLTKNFTDIARPLAPMIRIDLDLPDGTSHNKIVEWRPEEFGTASGSKKSTRAPSSIAYDDTSGQCLLGVQSGCGACQCQVQSVAHARCHATARQRWRRSLPPDDDGAPPDAGGVISRPNGRVAGFGQQCPTTAQWR